MSTQTMTNCVFILVGAIIMLLSIAGTKRLLKAMPLVPQRQRKHVQRYLALHRGLMVFFFLGYIAVMSAFAFRLPLVSETLVSLIFLLGAVFVFIGIVVQSRLLAEVQRTLQGIVPICARCKKIRAEEGNPRDPNTWKEIEAYISERTDADFSHGLCPKCFDEEMKDLDQMKCVTTSCSS